MRILFVNSIRLFGGGEVWLLRTMEALSDRGHRVHLLCRPHTPLEARARKAGFSVFTLPFRGDFDPFQIVQIIRLMRRLKIEVVCTNMDKELRLSGLAAHLAGVRAVVPRRGVDYPLKNTWAYRLSYQKLASGILANSLATKRALLRNAPWLDPCRIRVVYNGIDPCPFLGLPRQDLRTLLGFSPSDYVIGYVGRMDERKGVMTLRQAFEHLTEKIQEAKLLWVGTGPLEHALRIQSLYPDRMVFTGYRDDIPDVMKAIDVLVLPSRWEGFGLVLIEAMAAGKPVVTTEVSNMPEIVTDGVEGFLVPVEDPLALSDRLAVLRDLPLRKRMGEAGRKTVMARFTLDRMVDELEAAFEDFSGYRGSS